MGFFQNLKNLFKKKEKDIEEVKEEYKVETIEELKEELEEPTEIVEQDYDIDDDGINDFNEGDFEGKAREFAKIPLECKDAFWQDFCRL